MKCYIVLSYILPNADPYENEICRVERVYSTRKAAEKRAVFLNKVHGKLFEQTFHVIEKTLRMKRYKGFYRM